MQVLPPHRASRRYTQRLVADPATVFPLLCPVREAEWIDGWDPRQVFTTSGVAEPGCVFITAAGPDDAVWMVTRHEPVSRVEMVKITPRVTACHLAIVLRAVPGGCEADITYTHTSLGPAGDGVVDAFTPDHYEAFMRDWEGRLNHYLRHGTVLVGPRD